MSHFVNKLDASISKQMRGNKFIRVVILNRAFGYKSTLLNDIVVVPEGFSSDGASTPKLLWNLYPPFGQYLEAAVLHDWYCVLGNNGNSPISSVTAAKLFLEAMELCGVSKWKRTKMYWAVRMFGPRFNAKTND